MKHRILSVALTVCALLTLANAQAVPNAGNSSGDNTQSFVGGRFVANNYSYGNPQLNGQAMQGGQVATGNAAIGAATIVLRQGYIVLPDGRSVMPYGVGIPIVINDANPELIVPTAVSSCNKGSSGTAGGQDQPFVSCTITATFAATHGAGATTSSGTGGAGEAALDAFNWGGGTVVLAPGFTQSLNTSCTGCYASLAAAMAAIPPLENVTFEDLTASVPQYWTLQEAVTTQPAAPALGLNVGQVACDATHQICSDTTVVGTWTAAAYYECVAYVDVMGIESPCSATTNFTAVVNKAIDVGPPAASTGMVGYTIYIGTTYAAAVQVPLTSANCTLTKIETTTPACAIANATYGQVASTYGANTLFKGGAVIPTLTVTTSPLKTGTGYAIASTTSIYNTNSSARTVYAYAPSNHVGLPGVKSNYLPFTIGAAAPNTAIPQVLGTVYLPAGFMNYPARSIQICGHFTEASAGSTSTITTVQFWWDAPGSDTATGVPILIGGPSVTATLITSNADFYSFCQNITTTVSSTSVTGGSLLADDGWLSESYGAGVGVVGSTGPTLSAGTAVGSLNLTQPARIHIVYLHTTGQDGAATQLNSLNISSVN